MATFPFEIVGFDLDGTLLETHRDLGTAVNHALVLGGFVPVPLESATELIGGGAKLMLKQAIDRQGGLEDGEFRKLYKAMLAYYGENFAVHTRPYPGALQALDELSARGVRLGVITNKFESFARGVLAALDLLERFDCVIGGDSLGRDTSGAFIAKPAKEPILRARECCGAHLSHPPRMVYVGDSSYDMKAARAAKVSFVAACYGYCDRSPEDFEADGTINSFPELIAVLEKL